MFTNNSSNQLDDQLTTQIDESLGQKSLSQQLVSQKNILTLAENHSEDTKEMLLNIHPCVNMFNDNFNISEVLTNLYAKVSEASYITRYDRELIRLTLLQDNLKEEEHRIINRLLYSIRRGWIELVDDVHSTLVFDQSRRFLQGLNSVA